MEARREIRGNRSRTESTHVDLEACTELSTGPGRFIFPARSRSTLSRGARTEATLTKINNPEMVMATDSFALFAPVIWSTEPDST